MGGFYSRIENVLADESPEYLVSFERQFPGQSLGVTLTDKAPRELVHHAFNLKVSCLTSWDGCWTVA